MSDPAQPAPQRRGWKFPASGSAFGFSVIGFILLVVAVVIFVLLAIHTIDKPDDKATALYWGLGSFAASFFPWPL